MDGAALGSSRIANADDATTWEKMAAIKARILKIWDDAAAGVRCCCIKFVQRVIHAQTPGLISDPRVSRALGSRKPEADAG